MNDTGIRPEVIEEIRNLAQKYDIEKVILFGSRARGDFRRTSDIDIACHDQDLQYHTPEEYLSLHPHLTQTLQNLLL